MRRTTSFSAVAASIRHNSHWHVHVRRGKCNVKNRNVIAVFSCCSSCCLYCNSCSTPRNLSTDQSRISSPSSVQCLEVFTSKPRNQKSAVYSGLGWAHCFITALILLSQMHSVTLALHYVHHALPVYIDFYNGRSTNDSLRLADELLM